MNASVTETKAISKNILDLCEKIAKKGKEYIELKEEKKNKEARNKKNEIVNLYRNLMLGTKDNQQDTVVNYLNSLNKFSEIDVENFLKHGGVCEAIGAGIDFKTTQLRKLFHSIKSIKQEVKKGGMKLHKLRVKLMPVLAYARGRDLIDKEFFEFSQVCLTKIQDNYDFEVFSEIFEAIVAYHRYYNPSNQ